MNITVQIRDLARELVRQSPQGIRISDLKNRIRERMPDVNEGTLGSQVGGLVRQYPNEISKPDFWMLAPITLAQGQMEKESEPEEEVKVSEEQYYDVVANFLKNDLEECQRAFRLGGNSLGSTWNTPDVIGTNKHSRGMRIEFPTEIISAEVKSQDNLGVAITGFGQAVAYKLFSTKSYLVLPIATINRDRKRLIALCQNEGIGLVGFNPSELEDDWDVLLRASRNQPDLRYANDVAAKLSADDTLKQLFD